MSPSTDRRGSRHMSQRQACTAAAHASRARSRRYRSSAPVRLTDQPVSYSTTSHSTGVAASHVTISCLLCHFAIRPDRLACCKQVALLQHHHARSATRRPPKISVGRGQYRHTRICIIHTIHYTYFQQNMFIIP